MELAVRDGGGRLNAQCCDSNHSIQCLVGRDRPDGRHGLGCDLGSLLPGWWRHAVLGIIYLTDTRATGQETLVARDREGHLGLRHQQLPVPLSSPSDVASVPGPICCDDGKIERACCQARRRIRSSVFPDEAAAAPAFRTIEVIEHPPARAPPRPYSVLRAAPAARRATIVDRQPVSPLVSPPLDPVRCLPCLAFADGRRLVCFLSPRDGQRALARSRRTQQATPAPERPSVLPDLSLTAQGRCISSR